MAHIRHTLPPCDPEREEAWQKGRRTEEAFFDAVYTLNRGRWKPDWLTWIDKASREDDENGVDAWARTEHGDIPIQIKSSEGGARQHIRDGKASSLIVVIPEGAYCDDILIALLRGLEQWIEERADKRP